MATAKAKSTHRGSGRASKDTNLLVRLDKRAKAQVQKAAQLQGLTVSDYVRSRVLPLARQELDEAETGVLRLPKDAQIAFWRALQSPPPVTPAQRALGKLIRSVL